jgi:hypothetical protein
MGGFSLARRQLAQVCHGRFWSRLSRRHSLPGRRLPVGIPSSREQAARRVEHGLWGAAPVEVRIPRLTPDRVKEVYRLLRYTREDGPANVFGALGMVVCRLPTGIAPADPGRDLKVEFGNSVIELYVWVLSPLCRLQEVFVLIAAAGTRTKGLAEYAGVPGDARVYRAGRSGRPLSV